MASTVVLGWSFIIGALVGILDLHICTCTCERQNSSVFNTCEMNNEQGEYIRFGGETTDVVLRRTRNELCRVLITFERSTLVELKLLGGNLSESGYVFFEQVTDVNSCDNELFNVVTTYSPDGCDIYVSGNMSIYLYLQTSEIQVINQNITADKVALCSKRNYISGGYSFCEGQNFNDGNRVYEDVIRCQIYCRKKCSCTLGNKEFVSFCGDNKNNSLITLLVYPVSVPRLHLGNIGFTSLRSETFRSLSRVRKLFLNNNKLTSLPNGVFDALTQVHFLNISCNSIHRLQPNVFVGMSSLKQLDLENNNITGLPKGVFNGLENLERLDMSDNKLTSLKAGVFLPLFSLKTIRLRNNKLREIVPGAMNSLSRLETIDTSFNSITHLQKGVLKDLFALLTLHMINNFIERIDPGVFEDTPNLQQLYIYGDGNTLTSVSRGSFYGLTNNTTVLVNHKVTCCFVTSRCESRVGGTAFLTCERLLPHDVLRVFMWILGICAFLGNILVLYWRYSRKVRENPVQSFLITNLSISDFLMGVYMLTIASADVYFGSNFPPRAAAWRNGLTCKFAGFLAMVSSEASVFFVTLISVDRLLRIKYPFSRFTLHEKSSYLVTFCLWIIALVISVVAIILTVVSSDLYDTSDVCIGLPLARKIVHQLDHVQVGKNRRLVARQISSEPGMFFSMAIFLGLNLLCFLLVAICYLQIFIAVKKSSKKSGGSADKEVKLAIKMAVIIWTDFCCWVPIAILGILVQSGAIEISPVVYAWTVTFILPINSSVNPFLYTITTLTTEQLRKRIDRFGETLATLGLIKGSV